MEVDELIPELSSPSSRETETETFRRLREGLRDDSGQSYADLKNGLVPNYGWVWLQLAVAYSTLIGAILVMLALQPYMSTWWKVGIAGVFGGALVGYVVAFIALWLHEAAHFNVHADRAWNDRLANVFLGPIVLHDVRQYRRIHFAHHKHLGTINDTERSYFNALDVRYFIESLTGIKVFRVLLTRVPGAAPVVPVATEKDSYVNWASPVGAVLHLGVVVVGIYIQNYALAATWIIGVFLVYPFLGGFRQVLEHRKPDARAEVDYSQEPHGEYTRVFTGGLFSRIFGGAGFNRHLIHHWDPGISCTCFAEVERFFQHSQLREFYASRTTTYGRALKILLQQSSRERLANAG